MKKYVNLPDLTVYDEEIKKYIQSHAVAGSQSNWNETDSSSLAYIQNKPTLGTASEKDVATSGDASSTQVVTGNDSRLSDARPASDVSAWAKASTKPSYTASEVGALPDDTVIPSKTSDLTNDTNYVSDESYVHTDNNYTTTEKNKLSGIASGAEVNQNAFSNVVVGSTTIAADVKTDTLTLEAGSNITITPDATNDKITIAATDTKYTAATAVPGKVASASAVGSSTNYARQDHTHGIDLATGDSNGQVKIAGSNVSVKGLADGAYKSVDTVVTSGSSNLITSGAVSAAISDLPKPMIMKGTLGTGGTIISLPTATSSNVGYTYKVITAGTYASQSAKVGDTFTSTSLDGSTYTWLHVPSGDDIEDTWRNVKINGTEKLGTGISSGAVDFVNGINTTVSYDSTGNKISINATDTTYSSKAASSGGTDVSLVTTGEKYTWNNKSNLVIGATSTTAAAGNHTHTTSITASTGTNQITLAANTKYAITAGGTSYVFTTPPDTNTNNAVTQTATNTSADYEVLFSATADNTTRTEGARKYSNLTFNPSTGNLKVTRINGVTVGSSPKFTDTNTWTKVSTTADGYITKLPGDTSKYFRGDGSWATLTAIAEVISSTEPSGQSVNSYWMQPY